jgi:ATP-dependent protease ClpP protease subunit
MSRLYVSFFCPITARSIELLAIAAHTHISKGGTELYLLLSSGGGDPAEALGGFNLLRGLPLKVTTHNAGRVASAANILFLAGSTRYTCEHSTFVFHRVTYDFSKEAHVDEHKLWESLALVRADHISLCRTIASQTNISSDAVDRMIREGEVQEPAAALAAGVIHDIREIEISRDAKITMVQL